MGKVDLASMLEHLRISQHVWLIEEALNEGLVTWIVQILFGLFHSSQSAKVDLWVFALSLRLRSLRIHWMSLS